MYIVYFPLLSIFFASFRLFTFPKRQRRERNDDDDDDGSETVGAAAAFYPWWKINTLSYIYTVFTMRHTNLADVLCGRKYIFTFLTLPIGQPRGPVDGKSDPYEKKREKRLTAETDPWSHTMVTKTTIIVWHMNKKKEKGKEKSAEDTGTITGLFGRNQDTSTKTDRWIWVYKPCFFFNCNHNNVLACDESNLITTRCG